MDLMPLLKNDTQQGDRVLHWLSGDSWAVRKGAWKLIGLSRRKQFPALTERKPNKTFLSNMIFNGLIDEVRIHNRALSADEIRAAKMEFQQTQTLNQPGTRPQDNLEAEAVTLLNMDGQTGSYIWDRPYGRAIQGLTNANIQVINLKARHRHYVIGETGSRWKPFCLGTLYPVKPSWMITPRSTARPIAGRCSLMRRTQIVAPPANPESHNKDTRLGTNQALCPPLRLWPWSVCLSPHSPDLLPTRLNLRPGPTCCSSPSTTCARRWAARSGRGGRLRLHQPDAEARNNADSLAGASG